jgi:membrane peptidoglycan carboxypeptidase
MVQPDTGDIQAIAQSAPWSQTQIDYAADYVHGGNGGYSIGSSAKIFTLAAALNAGLPAGTAFKSPAMMTVGGYTDCRGRSIAPWTVRNAEPSDNGKYTMKTGTWQSINTYYAQLERKVGICAAVRMAKKFGMVQATGQPVGQYPSFTLGAGNYDVVHEAAAYAGFAANGRYCAPVAITGVTDAAGRHLRVPSAHCSQVLDPNVAEAVTSILRGVLTKGTAKGQGLPGRQAAGKTGTCETFSCALFAGYTPNLAAAVWYGDPDAPYGDPSYGVYGANTAPIWRYSMLGALAGQPAESFREPADDYSINVRVPDLSGMSLASAEKALTTAGFGFRVSPRRSATSLEPVGTVDHTTPSAGDDIDTNTAVVLYMSG